MRHRLLQTLVVLDCTTDMSMAAVVFRGMFY
jgi:hypothetical protein